ncbi:sulfite exporter TauE/SafE family protein, partial [Paracoccus sp. MKU1]|uniref:sulfite exporter TauE/SafE family protein n=1 Tax=Paracoccus sp. MKU1 TaxID=1745182 RepID=UPI00128F5399
MQIYLPIAGVAVTALVPLGLGGILGLMSGLFGVGGGFLITPLLFFIGIPPAIAVATGANQVVASSFSGVLAHVKRKTVDFRMGWVLLAGGLVGSSAGVLLFNMLSRLARVDLVGQLCYVGFLGRSGARMLQESLRALHRARRSGPIKPMRRPQHGWVHKWPLKMKFRAS